MREGSGQKMVWRVGPTLAKSARGSSSSSQTCNKHKRLFGRKRSRLNAEVAADYTALKKVHTRAQAVSPTPTSMVDSVAPVISASMTSEDDGSTSCR